MRDGGRRRAETVHGWLSEDPSLLDEQTEQFLGHLYDRAPELLKAGDLARRFAALIRGDDDAGLEQWIHGQRTGFPCSRHRP